MSASFIDPTTPIPDLLDTNGLIKLLPSAAYDLLTPAGIRLWCHQHARYGLPTVELVDWLRAYFAGRRTIEIGSGAGDFAHHLGIPGTDSKLQNRPGVADFYAMIRQPRIVYPDWVEESDAEAAIAKHQPEVVFGSWITHWIDPEEPPPPGGGSIYGVREERILDAGITYVMLGNLAVHQYKPILRRPHEALVLPFLRSRAADPMLDRLFIWKPRD